ncbi:MAG: DUF4125 family protein [Lachnospiraceae bacterium]|nr:DUF4125 family protein [Lachnospiraceae bacterium]
MDINKIYEELDALKYPEIEGYLRDKIAEAKEKDIFDVYIPLLNELIGFFRDSTQFDKGRDIKDELIGALEHYGQHGTMNYATSLLNIANFDRAAGAYDDSLKEYGRCEEIYHGLLPDGDYLWAGLYNNKSLLYQEMGDNLAAIGALQDALYIVKEIPGREIEVATTYVNIAQSFASLGQIEEAKKNIAEALSIFEKGGNSDYHYSGACAVCGAIAYAKGEYDKASEWYVKAADIVRRVMGENDNVRLLESAAADARAMIKRQSDQTGDTPKDNEASGEQLRNGEPLREDTVDTDKDDTTADVKGLDICRSYYERFGAPVIHEQFPEYESQIAVGLFGEGSDCFGYDDIVSRDHDWGPGFMLLVRKNIFDKIGDDLKKAYDDLPNEYMGYGRMTTPEGEGRVGVICIEELLCRYLAEIFGLSDKDDMASALGVATDKELAGVIVKERLVYVPETVLAQFVNGEIWRDDTGVITKIREKIGEYYSDDVWRHKLGVSLILTGQCGQYNLIRELKRGDRATSLTYLSDHIKNLLHTLFIINRKYAPYDKWLIRAAGELKIHPEISDIMRALTDIYIEDMYKASAEPLEDTHSEAGSDNDAYARITGTIEITSQIMLQALKEIGVIEDTEDNWYLEYLGKKILNGSLSSGNKQNDTGEVCRDSIINRVLNPEETHMDKNELIDKIIKLEWEAFDKVDNEGGRAFCQDDWTTFEIMRKSQYLEWNEPLLESFIADFEAANSRGWNLITEKYARMEKTTSPEEYAQIEDKLPIHTEEQDAIIEQIVAIQVAMMEDVVTRYPKLADNARTLRTADDKPWDTSYETYLRGELGTYSEVTLSLYGMFIAELAKKGENLAYNIISNTAKLYGYDSIDAAEASL